MEQLDLFAKEEIKPPEPRTTVRLGTRSAQVPLAKRRSEATEKLKSLLTELEGEDILVSYCGGCHSHWCFDDLSLSRLKVGWYFNDLVILRGAKTKNHSQQHIRIFLDQLYGLREQSCNGKPYWLIDFWNGFGEYPIAPYKPKGYESLHIELAM